MKFKKTVCAAVLCAAVLLAPAAALAEAPSAGYANVDEGAVKLEKIGRCDDAKAYVTLQEANAVAVLDIASASFTGVYAYV